MALASVRATRETTIREGRETLRAVAGMPEAGERVGDEIFDGETEAAIFPGELPETRRGGVRGGGPAGLAPVPPLPSAEAAVDAAGRMAKMPHIRLDRALEFLLGDRFA